MKDLNILIVGGAMGFGALIAEMAVEAGARGIGIIDLADADAVLAPLAAKGVKVAAAKADIRTAPACQAAFDQVAATLGRVDTLVNCAAIYPRKPTLGVTSANVDEIKAKPPTSEIGKLLGVNPGMGKGLGLADDWAYNVIKNVGNYSEIFERSLGQGSPYKMPREMTALWNAGGVLFPLVVD